MSKIPIWLRLLSESLLATEAVLLRPMERSRQVDWWAVALLMGSLVSACSQARPDFGTMPRVEVPIEKPAEQDPTLFREPTPLPTSGNNTDPPDPAPLRTQDHFDYLLEFDKGQVRVVSHKAVHLAQPESTPRKVGRFAFELWAGGQLVDRVRFDFPLLGAGDAREEDELAAGLLARTSVRVPSSAQAHSARILDRKTREEVEVTWPPDPRRPADPR